MYSRCILTLVYCKGGYLIVGYVQIACLMDPSKPSWNISDVRWGEFLESICKDVECFFGLLKIRYKYLSNPVQSHDINKIEYAIKTCCTWSMTEDIDGRKRSYGKTMK